MPGREVFIGNLSVALFLQSQLGVPAVVDTDPPVIPGFLNIENVTPAVFSPIMSTGVSFSFTQSGAEDVTAYAMRSFAFGASRLRFKGQFLSSTISETTVVAPASGIMDFDGLVEDSIYFLNPRFITALAPFRLSAKFFLRTIAVTNGP